MVAQTPALVAAAARIDQSAGFGWHPNFNLVVLFGRSAKLLQHGVIIFHDKEESGARPTQTLTLEGIHYDIQRTLEDLGNSIIKIGWDWAFALFAHGYITQEHWEKAEEEEVRGGWRAPRQALQRGVWRSYCRPRH